ncbi:Pyridine nucleotide-disulphide oxidoreductase family protein associated with PFOR [hydrothermal vent metagenome]|uniref:Pyridine nucleotide-disulphide oxidoreductase family protein associated with PFOR n=1 Tax=hydrothermal vent metagenome TaxID=652676 RepID=A0A3B0UE67_9ZZZZ
MSKPYAITLDTGTSLVNHTGSWRTERPEFISRLAPCNNACPAGENVQGWLYAAEEGDYEQAWRILTKANPLPGVHGRVCYHPCEDACNRGQLDAAVSIHAVERFLGDQAIKQGWTIKCAPETGKKILIIGSGPSGLSAAWHLARFGHHVEIRDAAPRPGGMMRYGIPKYRLPRQILDDEIARIKNLGVTIKLNSPVDDVAALRESDGFDAVFVAIGAHQAKHVDIPARDAGGVLDAVKLLHDMEEGAPPPLLGRRVVIYGGGNTAMDAARTVRRLGADETIIVYRRTREQAPAHDFEMDEALEEGISFQWLSTIKQIKGADFTIEKMRLNEDGWPEPTGEFETLQADALILALGQKSDTTFLEKLAGVKITRDGMVEVNEQMMTGEAGVFAGGDMTPADRTVTTAVGHGLRAAACIDAWLRGEKWVAPAPAELASFDKLNSWYYCDADRSVQGELELARRTTSFSEVVKGLNASNALFEARRCLSCGNCFECDNCYGVCPDNAVIKLGPGKGFQFDYDYCKGCAICAAECPAGSIIMVPEQDHA